MDRAFCLLTLYSLEGPFRDRGDHALPRHDEALTGTEVGWDLGRRGVLEFDLGRDKPH